jgi:hypothetical protein
LLLKLIYNNLKIYLYVLQLILGVKYLQDVLVFTPNELQ